MPVITVRALSAVPAAYRFDKDLITIGRSKVNDLVLLDPSLSRIHAEIRSIDGSWVVADRGSRNGTLLNGKPVLRQESLVPGDEIQLGGATLLFESEVDDAVAGPMALETLGTAGSAQGTGEGQERVALIGDSPTMQEIQSTIEKVASTLVPVLIVGESGTGKELVARLLHARSPRASKPFSVLNCPALPGTLFESELFGVEKGVATGVDPRPGRLETADGGTLLLDEVGDLEIGAQAKLLRFLEDGAIDRVGARKPLKVDVRIVAATNHDLAADMAQGRFRRDLFHRLNVVTIDVPPLRERREDIPLLVEHFLLRVGGPARGISADALELLFEHGFPGNVRELEHVVERAALLTEGLEIGPEDLPGELRDSVPAGERGPSTPEAMAHRLFERIVERGESFWKVVRGPFLRRELPGEAIQHLVKRAYNEGGYTYRGAARLFRIESDYKRFVNFLRNHKLRVGD